MSTPFARDSRLVLAALRAGYPITVAALAAATLLTTFRVIDLLAVLTAKGQVAEATVKVYSLPNVETDPGFISPEDTIAIIRRDSAAALKDVIALLPESEKIAIVKRTEELSEASNTRYARA